MSTRRHQATCCRCVCSWRVVSANRDLGAVRFRRRSECGRRLLSGAWGRFSASGLQAFGFRCCRHRLWCGAVAVTLQPECGMAISTAPLQRIQGRHGRFWSSHERHPTRRPCHRAVIRQVTRRSTPVLFSLQTRGHFERRLSSPATSVSHEEPSGTVSAECPQPCQQPCQEPCQRPESLSLSRLPQEATGPRGETPDPAGCGSNANGMSSV